MNNALALSLAYVNLGRLAVYQGEFARAKTLCRKGLKLREEMSDRWGLVQCLEPLAAIAVKQGDARRAAVMLGAIDVLLETVGAQPPLIFRADHEHNVATAGDALDENEFAEAFAEGRGLTVNEVVNLALDESAIQNDYAETRTTNEHFLGSEKRAATTARTLAGFSQLIKRRQLLAALVLIGLFVGAATALGFYFYATKTAAVGDNKSIVVLPLKPINLANRDQIYEIGIADSLIQRLGSIQGFTVRPLSAIRKYADIEQDPIAAGQEQQADYVLASNYQIAGGRIRVTAQLFNVTSGQIEETYKGEKDANDIFAMQDAVADEIGKLLQSRFAVTLGTSAAKRGTENEDAYRLYLQAQYLLEKGGAPNAKRALELFDQALVLDPNYAKAWSGKARAHWFFSLVGNRVPDEEYAVSKQALERAFALDNNLSEAYAIRGVILNDYDWDFANADKQFLRAIELAPDSALAYRWYARRLAGQARYDEAVARIKTAIDLNPSSITEQIVYSRILYFARRYDEAITQLQRVVEIDASQPETYAYLWRCYHMKGDEQRAYENFIKFHQSVGTKDEFFKKYQTAYANNGWRGTLQTALNIRQAEATTGNGAYDAAMLSALLNQSDQAFRYLDDAVEKRSANISNLLGDPGLDSLRGDWRFAELVKRVKSN
jgi:TolB-like protein/Tfp pilus assembly protein PilF